MHAFDGDGHAFAVNLSRHQAHAIDAVAFTRMPLAQTWQSRSNLSILPIPRQLRVRSSRTSQLVLEPGGGCIYAAHERGLREARRAVERLHAGQVRFEPPIVRTRVDPTHGVMVPLMFVKAVTQQVDYAAVITNLRSRRARLHEIEMGHEAMIIRAQARLADLLGFEDAVRSIARAPVRVASWLVRYAPDATLEGA